MKRKFRLLFITTFCILTLNVLGQTIENKNDNAILLTEICINNICFGDSITKIINCFGIPDTVMYRPRGDWEFEEPTHNVYVYSQFRFYEIIYPHLSEGLLYGCRINIKDIPITLRDFNMLIGETTMDSVISYFDSSEIKVSKEDSTNYLIVLYTKLPPNLKSVEGAFISKIDLYFTNGLLRQVWTQFDLN